MQRWIAVMFSSALVALGCVAPTSAQTTTRVGGGLTALPAVSLGPDRLANGGFETLSGGLPAAWTAGSGWAVDQVVRRSGTFSYRASGAFGSSTQTVQLRRGIYRLSGWIRTQNVGSGGSSGVRLTFDYRPHANMWMPTDVISGTRDWTRYELPNLVVSQDITVTIRLENYNNSGGTVWFDDIRLEEQQAPAVDVFMLYPNFRGMLFDDGPATMRFDVALTPPGGDLGRYRVTGTLRDESTNQVILSQNYTAAASFVAEMNGTLMQHGRPYRVTFSLVDQSNNQAVYSYPAFRVSRVPAGARAGMRIAFDEKNRVLVRGVPRFVLGVYDSGFGYNTTDAYWESQLWSPTGERRMDGMRINFYLNYWFGEAPVEAMRSLMANLQKRNVMYLQTGNCFDRFPAGNQFLINSSDAYVRDLGAHPGSGGYYTVDECRSELIPGAFAQYDRLRRLDPDSLTFSTNFGNPDLPLWREAADIISTDPYPLFGAQPAGGYNHGQVGQWTASTRDAVKNARPFMTVLQFFKFTSQGRWPTLQEMRNHAWMAIVEGAHGLWWWSLGDNALRAVCSGWCAEKTTYMTNLKTVVNEVADLEPALLADDAPGALSGNSNAGAIRTKVKLHNGRGYVFAYNTTNATASATFTWNTTPGTVSVHGEGRSVPVSSRSFTDSFGPFQAHVYVLGTGGTGGGGGGGTPGTPGAPTVSFVNPPAGGTVSGSATVTLAASGGTGSGYSYQLAVDGTNVYTGTNATFSWNTTNVANGSRTLTATVTDSGSRSGTATRTVTVSNPTTAPPPANGGLAVSLTAPAANATVSGTNWAVVWVNGAATGSKVYTLSVGGQAVGTTTTSSAGPVSIPWNTASVGDGSRVLTASVRDAANGTGSASRTVTVSNGTPSVPALTVGFTSPAAGATVSGTVTVGLTASGGSGSGYGYRLAVDGVQVATAASYSWNTTAVTNGGHTLTATVTDPGGRTATATRTVTVSNPTTAPPPPSGGLTVAITAPTDNAIVQGTNWAVVWVNGAATGSKVYTLRVNGQTVGTTTTTSSGPVSIPWKTTRVANGSRVLKATVTDAAGNTGVAGVTVRVRN